MKSITESERWQLLEATCLPVSESRRLIDWKETPPTLPMGEYLKQVEQLSRIFPKPVFVPVRGDHWRL